MHKGEELNSSITDTVDNSKGKEVNDSADNFKADDKPETKVENSSAVASANSQDLIKS